MTIARLSNASLKNIIKGRTRQSFNCVIKFYSNKCNLCHGLKDIYEKVAEAFQDDVHFFVFNSAQYDDLDSLIDINGTPTIVFVEAKSNPRIKVMQDPPKPDEKSWYYAEDIMQFIEDNLDD